MIITKKITSVSNEHVKEMVRIAEDVSFRKKRGLAVLCGPKLCGDALDSGVKILEVGATLSAMEKYHDAFERCAEAAEDVYEISDAVDRKIEGQRSPQGMYALVRIPEEKDISSMTGAARIIILAGVQDPGNAGTIIRTAAALGFRHVILGSGCADIWSEKVLRASMGSCFKVTSYRTDDLAADIDVLKESGVECIGASLGDDSVDIRDAKVPGRLAVVIGSEGRGIPEEIERRLSSRVIIPMSPDVESLNAAAAAAIMMWNFK